MSRSEKVTTVTIRNFKSVRPITALTAYDRITADLADASGVDLILVGDSLGMTMLGYRTTLPVTTDIMVHHTAAVASGNPRALVVTDVPFAEAHQGIPYLVGICARYLRAGAEAVKIEGGEEMQEAIRALVRAGIPVLGHIGLCPQQIMNVGKYRKFGKTTEERQQLLKDAKAVQDAGAFAIVAEMVDAETCAAIAASVNIPIIGIGSGAGCDGQILVISDVLGLTPTKPPSFAKVYVDGRQLLGDALKSYVQEVQQKQFPKS